jgi:hypothetical protein
MIPNLDAISLVPHSFGSPSMNILEENYDRGSEIRD